MASTTTPGYRPIALPDWRGTLQSLAAHIETLEADHPLQISPEKEELSANLDELYRITTKLCFLRDFMQTLEDPKNCISKRTPEGLSILLRECIDSINRIGGFNRE